MFAPFRKHRPHYPVVGFVVGPEDVPASFDTSRTGGSTSYPTAYEALKSAGGSYDVRINATDALTTGKWYLEIELIDNNVTADFLYFYGKDTFTGGYIRYFGPTGQPQSGGIAHRVTDWDPWDAGDILMLAIDVDELLIWTGKNGVWDNSADPASGLDPTSEFSATFEELVFQYRLGGTGNIKIYTGQEAMNYDVPEGFHPGWYIDN